MDKLKEIVFSESAKSCDAYTAKVLYDIIEKADLMEEYEDYLSTRKNKVPQKRMFSEEARNLLDREV